VFLVREVVVKTTFRAFVEGTAGEGFDHSETLTRIQQPVLFLHANFFMRPDARWL
jgi:hypothetical protein